MPSDLPEYAGNPFIARLPPIHSAAGWLRHLETLPHHDGDDRLRPAHERMHCVARLQSYFDPNERHLALASRIDLMIRQGYLGRNPLTTSYYQRLKNDHARIVRKDLTAEAVPMTSTASSLTLIGVSGMGKTISTTRILHRYPETIVHDDPFHIVRVPWVRLECPYKDLVKQLCLSFFARMDELLGTDFARRHGGARSSIDGVVLQMAAIANRHAVGLIVIDEIQHLMEARSTGRDEMLNFLVTLVNHCSTPVMLIGTPRALPLLQGAFRQARRVSGLGSLSWDRVAPGAIWDAFVTQLWSCQWTREPSPLTDEIRSLDAHVQDALQTACARPAPMLPLTTPCCPIRRRLASGPPSGSGRFEVGRGDGDEASDVSAGGNRPSVPPEGRSALRHERLCG